MLGKLLRLGLQFADILFEFESISGDFLREIGYLFEPVQIALGFTAVDQRL
jgi:hypothetical protein